MIAQQKPIQGESGNQTVTSGLAPALLGADKAAELLDICRRHFLSLDSTGRLGPMPVKLGRCVKWVRVELEAWVAARCPTREEWIKLQEDRT